MQDCIFCKLRDLEIPSEKVYEDDLFFVLLDIHPYVPGHCLVIPKEHVNFVWDVSKYENYMFLIRRVAQALRIAFNTSLVQGGIAGVDVAHAHFHLFPRNFEDAKSNGFPSEPMQHPPSEFETKKILEKIRMALGSADLPTSAS